MECDFQVGDAVVCIEELTPENRVLAQAPGPVLDERYTVERAFPALCIRCGCFHVFIRVKEIQGPMAAFDHRLFRKLLTIDDFKSVETDAPVDRIKEPELA